MLKEKLLKNKNYVILLAMELFLILFLLPGCFRENEVVSDLMADGLEGWVTESEEGVSFESKRLSLSPGVYRIKVEADLLEGQYVNVEMLYDKAHFHALRTNEVELSSKHNSAGIEVYVTDTVSTAYVNCEFAGVDETVLTGLAIYRTGLGNQVLLVMVIFAVTLLNLLIYFRGKIAEGKVSKKQQIVIWGLVATAVMACFPYLTDYIIVGEDTLKHCEWLADYRMGLSVMMVYKLFVLDLTMATAITAYCACKVWLREEYTALAGSIIYLLNPWRLIHVYSQGAVDKCLMWLFVPVVLVVVNRLLGKRIQGAIKLKADCRKYVDRAFGILALVTAVAAIYQLNRIAFESQAVYLYAEEALWSLEYDYATTGMSAGYKKYAQWGFVTSFQLGTALTAWMFFKRLFAEETSKLPAVIGVLLYLICPYRIYVCYDLADTSQAVAWMLLPVYGWAMCGIAQGDKRVKGMLKEIVIGGVALAGIGYVNEIFFLTVFGVTLLAGPVWRRLRVWLPAFAGAVLCAPRLYQLAKYLFLGQGPYEEVSLNVIMEKGYRVGELFSAFVYKEGHPGMGLGILICLVAGLWLRFVKGVGKEDAVSKALMVIAGLLMVLSLRYFPWDVVQRLGGWSLRLVGLIGTPAFFGGIAFACLCVPAAGAVRNLIRTLNK